MNQIEDAEYIRLGKKAREQSLRFAIENLQIQLDELLGEGEPTPRKRTGRTPNVNAHGMPIKKNSYWGRMTPAERKTEQQRRRLVAVGKAPSQQQGWRLDRYRAMKDKPKKSEQQSRANHSWWSTATPAQKKKRLAAMVAGKNKANGQAVNT